MAGNLSRSNDLRVGQGLFLKISTALCVLFLLAPLVVLIVYSFNASRQVTVWGGFSLKWYVEAFLDRDLWTAIRNSMLVAGISATLSTILGTMTALALGRYTFRGRSLCTGLLYVPVIMPEIILGIALLALFVMLDLPRGFVSVLCGHITFSFPFVALLILARVKSLDRTMEEASLDLGASPWHTFCHVLLPALAPSIVSGLLFSFTISLDNFVVTFFTTGPQLTTLPMKVYSMVKFGLTPVVNVISTLLILFTGITLMAITWMQQDGARRRLGMRLGLALAAILGISFVVSLVSEARQTNLVIGTWAGYMDPSLMDDFESQTGIHVILTYFNDGEEMLAKASFGNPGFDLIIPAAYAVETLRELDLLAPFDFERIPNIEHIDPRFRHLPFDPSGQYYIPYTYGVTGLAYNSEKIKEPVDSWRILWDPRYQDRIAMFDDMLETFHLAHRLLGYDMKDADPAHLDAAYELLLQQKPLLRKYESNLVNDMLLREEIYFGQNWNGNALRLIADHPQFKFVIPKEGSLMFADNICLLKTAPNPDAAHLFIDFLLQPENTARNIQTIQYAMPNPDACLLLPQELRENMVLFPPLGDMSNLQILPDYGTFLPKINERWVRLKSE
ncbi:MAG: extracellular solute-binding protein [Kiritimatiellae bacterium]|nr:extracellular solute-binding protein [Kiritimatiellia bacterium]